jgi:menaquinone-dependent protoporphyrinogen oxidase
MSRVLIAYSTTDGHTRRIGERLADVIEGQGHGVVLKPVADCDVADLQACDAVVIGAAIRYGHHKPEVAAFITQHQGLLDARANAFFSVNVVARKPGKDRPEGNPYLRKFLRVIAWQPQRLAVFAGRIDYPSLGRLDRAMIRLIMWMTDGPTDPTRVFEFTDWSRVAAFGTELAAAFRTDSASTRAAGGPGIAAAERRTSGG